MIASMAGLDGRRPTWDTAEPSGRRRAARPPVTRPPLLGREPRGFLRLDLATAPTVPDRA